MAWKFAPKETFGFQRRYSMPTEYFNLSVEVDWDKVLRDLGSKAAFNKSGTSRALNGALTVRAKKLQRIAP